MRTSKPEEIQKYLDANIGQTFQQLFEVDGELEDVGEFTLRKVGYGWMLGREGFFLGEVEWVEEETYNMSDGPLTYRRIKML